MDIVEQLFGGIDHASLFGINAPAAEADIIAAQRDCMVYGEAVNRLVAKIGLRPGEYVRNQPLFGPLVRLLALAGWTLSGTGYFSACFYKGGLAIKLSLRGSGDSAIEYARWAKDNDDVAGVPMVYAIGEWSHTAAVLMERYEKVGHMLDPEGDFYDPQLGAEFEDIKHGVEHGELPGYACFATGQTALTIHNQFKGSARYDIHYDNVMADRDGNLVITDPLGRSRDSDTRYGGYSYYSGSNDNYSQAA